MPSPLELIKSFFAPDTVESVKAPIGAWIPPQTAEAAASNPNLSVGAGGRPVMDAAYAHAHNESLFSGMLSWGPVMGIALLVMAFLWNRFLRH